MKLRLGLGSCGIAAGGLQVLEALQKEMESRGIILEIQKSGCIGLCHHEPLLDWIEDDGRVFTYGAVDAGRSVEILEAHLAGHGPLEAYLVSSSDEPAEFLQQQLRIVLKNCGRIDPESIDDYRRQDGYSALHKVLTGMSPEEVAKEIEVSALRGRGGAGFPTGLKWKATREAAGLYRYIICNADEGDPGAFMDRSILEGDPHAVLEGMIIGAYAIGAEQGIIYCRAEYPLAVKRLEIAIAQARENGLLGQRILGSEFSFDISIQQGAGAFVCGEETALIASLEGERGMPRLKPPYPSESGLWGYPSSINNVETLANVPWIIRNGGEAFAALGSRESKGTKVFALAGKIKRGGLVEVPMGTTLREIIYNIGGGVEAGRRIKAVQMGGPSGGCIPAELLDIPVDYQSLGSTGAIMGSGGMVVLDESSCMVDLARFFLDFTQKESCGKCVQCRIGTKRMLEILERICQGAGQAGDIELLEELSAHISENSLCGLGQSAPNPVLTTIRYFRDEYEAHIREKKCPAKQCQELLKYTIDPDRCMGCGLCVYACPADCIKGGENNQPYYIEQENCSKCGACLDICPERFAAVRVPGT